MEDNYIIILVTTTNKEEAEKISKALLNEKLVACVNIIGPVSSFFWWQEKIENAEEYMLIMKSHSKLFEKLSEKVKALHSYEVPEIIALPIIKGHKAYVEWLDRCIKQSQSI